MNICRESAQAGEVSSEGALRQDDRDPPVPVLGQATGGMPPDGVVVDIHGGQLDARVARSEDERGDPGLREPALNGRGGAEEQPADMAPAVHHVSQAGLGMTTTKGAVKDL